MDLLEESQDPPEICRADFENCWSRSSKVWGTNQLPITASLPAQGDCHVTTSNLRPPHLSFSFPVKTRSATSCKVEITMDSHSNCPEEPNNQMGTRFYKL